MAFQSKGGNCIHRGTLTITAEDWSDAVVKAANFTGPLNLEITALEDEAASDRLDSRLLLVEAAVATHGKKLESLSRRVQTSTPPHLPLA